MTSPAEGSPNLPDSGRAALRGQQHERERAEANVANRQRLRKRVRRRHPPLKQTKRRHLNALLAGRFSRCRPGGYARGVTLAAAQRRDTHHRFRRELDNAALGRRGLARVCVVQAGGNAAREVDRNGLVSIVYRLDLYREARA